MYFSANSSSGNVLYSSNGTETGTTVTGHSFIFNPLKLGNLIYYINTIDSNSLYQFNGTTQTKVANSGTEDLKFIGGVFTSLNNKIIGYGETTTDEPTIGRELYEYNPTTDAFTLIKDIDSGTGDSSISNFVTLGTNVYFKADGKVWKTDGTTTGTSAIDKTSTINNTNQYFVWNGNLYFEGDDGSDDQLWKYDPTADTILNISNITGSTVADGNNHDPSDYAVLSNYLYYRGETFDNSNGYIFRTNGITSEQLDNTIKDIDEITVLNDKLYFEGDDGVSGNELYSLDPATLTIEKVFKDDLKVFPNPTSNFINIPLKYLNSEFKIFSVLGNVIKEGKISSSKISVIGLKSGNYILKINNEGKTASKKIIIK